LTHCLAWEFNMPLEERTTIVTPAGARKGNGFLYFAVGALIVAVGVLAWMFYSGQTNRAAPDSAVERAADAIGNAADDIGDSARDATRNIPELQPAPAPQHAPVIPPG
jgi:hypothetical protein